MTRRNKSLLFAAISVFLIFGGSLDSQQKVLNRYMIVRDAPKFVIQINGAYNMAAFELGGVYNSDFHSSLVNEGKYFGTRNGLGASLVSKFRLTENSRIWLTQSISFNRLQSYLLISEKSNSDNGSANYNCYTGGVGIEYNFTPRYSVKMFAGAEVNASMINGNMTIWTPLAENPKYAESFDVTNSFRLGFGISSGVTFMLSKKMGLNFGAKYSNLNVLLKSAEGSDSDSEFTLRDGESEDKIRFSGKKNFSFFSVSAGLTFFFGVKEKSYKVKQSIK